MNSFLICDISGLAIHKVGNKNNEEGLLLSEQPTNIRNEISETLISYFISSFKPDEYYNLYHESDINLNEVYVFAGRIFDDPESLFEQSVKLAKHLYNCSVHPKIKGGEFYTTYFKECTFEGDIVDAIGLFKSEKKDIFLKVQPDEKAFGIKTDEGINVSKLDKGCLIFNKVRENGYVVSVVDNTGKGAEAAYWIDTFLKAIQRNDDFHNTHNVLSLCKDFITKQLPQEYEITKADQANLLNKSIKYFRDNESFSMAEFANEVIEEPELISKFDTFKTDYQEQSEQVISESFQINGSAVKKQSRVFKSVLKLDRNFHIYIHGDRDLIHQGIEPDGRKYYKIYFREES
ncbi:MAG TPA: nucleoid-associated protein [Bacteroidales bacterium]|nr:nucleoid-associated protein [Bacteroidales bacterium]